VIKFENVVKRFGDRTILNGISYELAEGKIMFALGKSGTGKSVMLKNIVGLLRPDEGKIWIDGEEVSRITEEEYFPVRKKCGMVFQHPALFDSLTVFENVAFGLRRHTKLDEKAIASQVKHSLALVNLENIEKKMPSQISYGMQKRVSLARTLALEPKVLLFDEPTTGLDPVTTNAVNQLIFSLSRQLKTTSIVVSHDMHCALDIADRVIVLDGGKVLEDASPQELRNSKERLVLDFLAEVEN
jgi:phospholipid/cholesterol/gamma-HCH transport system ATP-binding protein